ncbi:putative glyoxalase/bleomycin resistance protein/dihydroxybiphenyl dioxygenase family protein [Janthinobacterium sp. HH01]|uniref:VOC family protein n=1 Tax=Janthinobacterium sp. HH01 TaxID=1198452 RepID=UPI0002AE9541|nr:VOC family protein [Janthinobacterium sp. HH01]ELX13787.1 putative glyoxalase/bleomycin resistance protein/dihydroxybiphenyl dioxygenase family protein [Janthinobacterium sp. HH01]
MSIQASTHLNFRGDAREALGFYQAVFGGAVDIVTYQDAGNVRTPSDAKQVMWGQVSADSGFRIMAYDVPADMPWHQGENAFFVVVGSETAEELTACWDKLREGATITQPLAPSQWAPLFGMLKDRFGVNWVLNVVAGR